MRRMLVATWVQARIARLHRRPLQLRGRTLCCKKENSIGDCMGKIPLSLLACILGKLFFKLLTDVKGAGRESRKQPKREPQRANESHREPKRATESQKVVKMLLEGSSRVVIPSLAAKGGFGRPWMAEQRYTDGDWMSTCFKTQESSCLRSVRPQGSPQGYHPKVTLSKYHHA